jgi:hypothetical protein
MNMAEREREKQAREGAVEEHGKLRERNMLEKKLLLLHCCYCRARRSTESRSTTSLDVFASPFMLL